MKILSILGRGLTGLGLFLCASLAWGQWELDSSRSSVEFISVKNSVVAESHRFSSLVGYIGADGAVQLGINLDSVDTKIPVRDERLRESLFETSRFPTARISARVDPALLATAAEGGVVSTDIKLQLSLHGTDKTLSAPVTILFEKGARLHVMSTRPVIINATDFALEGGVNALREVAGLLSISTAVPVTVNLVFNSTR